MVGVPRSSSSAGMGGGAFLGIGLVAIPPQHASCMILARGDDALGGGERGCLLCGEDGLKAAGGNLAGVNDAGGALAAGRSVSSLPKRRRCRCR